MKILITGAAGSGKTTALANLQEKGFLVIDADATGRCVWRHVKTKETTQYGLRGRSVQWLKDHGWYADIVIFKKILDCVRLDKHVFVAGVVENIQEFSGLFDKVIVLEVPKETILYRLQNRTNNNFAKQKEEQDFVFNHGVFLCKKIQNKAIKIDGSLSTERVVGEILLKV